MTTCYHHGLTTTTHRPSGIMCRACAQRNSDCSKLDFAAMQKMKTDKDGIIVVRCDSFKKRCSA